MGDFCHCEASYLCHDDATGREVRFSFVVNSKYPTEIKANKCYPADAGWVVLDLPHIPRRILLRSYQISLRRTGTQMSLQRLAPCAGMWCCGRVDLRNLSSLDIAFACSSIFGGRLDSSLDCGTCGTVAPREEDGLTCTELILTSLLGWPVVAGLRPKVTSPAALHHVLDDLSISPTSTHYIASQVRGKRVGNDGGRFIGQTPSRDFSKGPPRAADYRLEQQQQRRPGRGREEGTVMTTTTTTTTTTTAATAAAAAAKKSVAKNV
jgi:hypothetical protein